MSHVIKGTGRDGSVCYVGQADRGIFMVDTPTAAIRGPKMNWLREAAAEKWPGLTWTIEAVEPRIKKSTGDSIKGRALMPLPARGVRVIRSHRGMM